MPNPDVVPFQPKNKIRIVTAGSLFDGHDVSINIMRRFLQTSGAEVIHLGHNRSVQEIVDCAIQEDVQGVAITSYQGGHLEFFKYMFDLLNERNAGHIKIFGGGGGTILPTEVAQLHAYGITRLYSPDDGRTMGLQGMINDLLEKCDWPAPPARAADRPDGGAFNSNFQKIARLITLAENEKAPPARAADRPDGGIKKNEFASIARQITLAENEKAPPSGVGGLAGGLVLGITGTGGAGKSSLIDELILRFLRANETQKLAIISVDPSKRKTGGALLGDRIRMNAINSPRVYMRSLATRQSNLSLSKHVREAVSICREAGFDLIILETSGIGQSDTEITDHADLCLYVMTSEYGAASQLEKIDMLDFADVIAINKFDKRGSLDALRDVRKQYRRNRNDWDTPDDALPIVGSIAAQFNDAGMNELYSLIMSELNTKFGTTFETKVSSETSETACIIPPDRVRYLAEIVESAKQYEAFVKQQSALASRLYQLNGAMQVVENETTRQELQNISTDLESKLHHDSKKLLADWPAMVKKYTANKYQYEVRGRVFEQDLYVTSLSNLKIPKISLPKYADWGDILKWLLTENVPGEFPFAAGVFPLKREGEDPARMFAGEGGPARTNQRFHYLSKGMAAKRLSTAFDSVTLYGEDPDYRPDIYGKVGNSGVNVCTLDDAKILYAGFDLCDPSTSVSMTINGPAPIILAFFLNAAIDQQCEKYLKEQPPRPRGEPDAPAKKLPIGAGGLSPLLVLSPTTSSSQTAAKKLPIGAGGLSESGGPLGSNLLGTTGDCVLPADVYQKIKADTLRQVRGTVQADILKEDQAQNTCIFSTEFALKMMGDIQAYFIENKVQNFYSVSISGYHIAEAGANPISQLAFTLSNGFTFVEYYLSRGMHIDDFAPNLSFFFSNGMDAEYTVLGRVARRIWAKAMKNKYQANDRSQKLKYHIQTSGRSLHAQEIAFNDIRTTLQALLALQDNCNSLHTNAYDEAITTPTEESVRRALAIQLIINKEFGLLTNENPLQGSFIVDELTELVENAVYEEFGRINERGGVLGAMERMYQRSKIQDESMHYETLKHTGQLPIVGVNTFLDAEGSPTATPNEVIRSTEAEKQHAVEARIAYQTKNQTVAEAVLLTLQKAALANENIFETLMEATKVCTLGQISNALYAVGGKYRRNT